MACEHPERPLELVGSIPAQRLVKLTQFNARAHGKPQTKARVEHSTRTATPASTESAISDRRLSDGIGAKANVRDRLRQWQSDFKGKRPVLPKEPSMVDNSNNLTRPMIAELQDVADGEDFEGLESYVQEFDRISEFSIDVDQSTLVMRRGDLVELHSNYSGHQLAVYLRYKDGIYQYLTTSGLVYNCRYRSASFVVPNFMDPEEFESIMAHVPSDLTPDALLELRRTNFIMPQDIASPVLLKLKQFRDDSEAAYRSFSSAIDHGHNIVAHPTRLKFMCLEDIVSELTGIMIGDQSQALQYAISTALLRGEWGFSIDPKSYAESRIVAVESKKDLDTVRRVQVWVRAYQEEMALIAGGFDVPDNISRKAMVLKNFARKAKALVAESRTIRYTTPEGTVLTCKPRHLADSLDDKAMIHSLEFSSTDKDFIQFMGMHTSSRLFYYHQQLRGLPSVILRAVDVYPGRALDLDFSHTFLVEIGVTQPYDNPFALDRDILPPIHDVEAEMEAMKEQIKVGMSAADVANLCDSMSAIRKDWGDLPVFCVDSRETSDVDDGISIQRIDDSDGEFWFHAHIAHISAFTSPDHVLGKHAETRGSSLYLPDARIAMLPDWATAEFSLAPNKPVITFSARMTKHGDILETKIQAGFIRNVRRISYDMLDDALEYQNNDGPKKSDPLIIKVGPDIAREKSAQVFDFEAPTESDKRPLRDLYNMARSLVERRPRTPFGTFATRTGVYTHGLNRRGPATYSTDQNLSHAQFSLINPSIEMVINNNYAIEKLDFEDQFNRPSRIVVQESMLLAGVIAAKWAADRNIPIVYYGTRAVTDGLEDFTKMLRQKVIELGKGARGWSRNISTDVLGLYALRHVAVHPVEHRLLGFSHYTKITSPLRRYLDLLSLWQIDAALREEARTGRSLVGQEDTSYLPLTRQSTKQVLRLQDTRMKRSSKYASGHQKHWVTLCLARAHYLKEAELPDPMTALVSKVGMGRHLARIEQLECSCLVAEGMGEDGNEPGDGEIWEVKIDSISPYERKIIVKAIRRLGTVDDLGSERTLRYAQ